MKKPLLLFSALLFVSASMHARIIGEGWYDTAVLTEGIEIPEQNMILPENSGSTENLTSSAVGIQGTAGIMSMAATAEGEGPEDIVNMAESLNNDPVKIIEYVRENIKTEVYYGVKKGALMTLYEKSGNDYDKCVLAMALLKAAGQDAEYYYTKKLDFFPLDSSHGLGSGIMSVESMLGLDTDMSVAENKEAALRKLMSNRIPYRLVTVSGIECAIMPRYKITKIPSGSTPITYELAVKSPSLVNPIDVVGELGFSANDISTAAGGTLNSSTNSVQALDEEGLNDKLEALSADLASLMSADVSQDVSSLTGKVEYPLGQIPLNSASPNLYVTFESFYEKTRQEVIAMYNAANGDLGFYAEAGLVLACYKGIPSYDYSKLRVYKGDATSVSVMKNLASLDGERLWIYFSGNTGYLKLGGNTWLSNNTTGNAMPLSFEIQHGYDGIFDFEPYATVRDNAHKQAESFRKGNTFVYNITYGFSDASTLLAKRQELYAEKLAAAREESGNFDSDGAFILTNNNLNDTQRDLLAEGLNVMGLTWLAQTNKANQVIAATHDCYQLSTHRMGKVAQEEGFYVDVKLQMSNYTSVTLNATDEKHAFRLSSFYASAMEHGVIQQLQDGAEAISTVNIFHYANESGNSLKALRSASDVDSLSNYSAAEKQSLKQVFTDDASSIILAPQNRSCVPSDWDWQGYGYVMMSDSRTGMMISGNLNGGYSAYNNYYTPTFSYTQYVSTPNITSSTWSNRLVSYSISSYLPSYSIPKTFGADPIDMRSGAYVYDTTDIKVGDTLEFSRYYNSNLNENKGAGLGYGWGHNYDITATPRTAWEEGLGNGTAEQASALVLSVFAAKEIFSAEPPSDADLAKNWAVTALIAKWATDGMLDNAVSIKIGKESMQFVKQYQNAGTEEDPLYETYFAPPAGTNYTLAKNGDEKYVVTVPYGDTIIFNTDNKIESISTMFGQETTFSYDTDKNLTGVTDPFNRSLSIAWQDDKIASVSSSTGRSVSYTYSGDVMTVATDVMGNAWPYEYDASNRLTVQKTPNATDNVILENVYSARGEVKEQYSHGDPDKTWTLTCMGTRSEETDPLGNVKKYYYDDRGFCTRIIDQNGNITSLQYDAQGREIKRVLPSLLLSSTTVEDTEAGTRTVTEERKVAVVETSYDNWHHKTLEQVKEVLNTTTLTYAISTGKLRSINSEDTSSILKSETAYTYEQGTDGRVPRLLSMTQKGLLEGENDRTETIGEYFSTGDILTELPLSATDVQGIVTTYTYDTSGRMLTESVGGRTTTYSNFNSYDQPQLVTYPDGGTETSTYNTDGDVTTATSRSGLVTTYSYDNKRRVIATSATGPGIDTPITTSRTYDAAGDVVAQTDEDGVVTATVWSAQQKKLSETVGSGSEVQTVTHVYDLADREVETVMPDGKQVTRALDPAGNVTAQTVDGKTVSFDYEANGKVKSTTSALGNTVSYEYDGVGNKIAMTDARGNTVHYAYNSFGERISLTNRNDATYQFRNDPAELMGTVTTPTGAVATVNYSATTGEVVSTVLPSGTTQENTYDTAGRLISIVDPVGTIEYAYNNAGEVEMITEGANQIAYSYDALGNVKTSALNGGTVSYTYTPGGKVASITYPAQNGISAKTVTYAYDSLGRLSTVTDWANRVTIYTYDAGSRLIQIERPNGTLRNLTYDPESGLLLEISETDAVGRIIVSHEYVYDDDGRMTSVARSPHNRLVPRASFTASYDDDNRLTSFRGLSVNYNADGNMTQGPMNELIISAPYVYDARNRLVNTGNAIYAYDAEDNRALMAYNDNGVVYICNYIHNRNGGQSEILIRNKNIQNSTAAPTSTYYVYGAGLAHEVTILPDGTETVRYYHYDQVGSTIAMTDENGSITDKFSYDTWGYSTHSIGTSDTPFRYVGIFGVQTDPNGLIHMRARYYNPTTMSFMNPDPLQFEGGLNWYQYANGNPLIFIDSDGEHPVVVAIVIGMLVSGALDVGSQVALEGRSFSEVNWTRTAIWATVGGVTGGIGAALRTTSVGIKITRFFYDARPFKAISNSYWATKSANGASLHHWLIPQRASWVPQGIRNGGWNLIELPAFKGVFHRSLGLNQWMGFARNWGATNAFKASAVENGIRFAIPGSMVLSGYTGSKIGNSIWNSGSSRLAKSSTYSFSGGFNSGIASTGFGCR